MKIAEAIKNSMVVKQTALVDSKHKNDTVRVWESYKDQALMWRALALIQTPVTIITLLFAFTLWSTHKTILNVPKTPAPGSYEAQEIPDNEFIEEATDVLNLIATYQPAVASRQFAKAREYMAGPFLAVFDSEMMGTELKAIQQTQRTQMFFVDPAKTKIERQENAVKVSFTGERLKIVAGRELPSTTSQYEMILRTIPHNPINPHGVVVTKLTFLGNGNDKDVSFEQK